MSIIMDNFEIMHENETAEKETLVWQSSTCLYVENCTFVNCHIIIKDIFNIVLEDNNFVNCTFDLDFSRTTKVDINDNFVSYPENVRALDECLPKIVPVSGGFYAYKFLMNKIDGQHCIAKLWIPEDARRSSAGSAKCRAEKALVVAIWSITYEWNHRTGKVASYNIDSVDVVNHKCLSRLGQSIKYEVGQYVIPDSWDNNRFAECTHGIHFFLDIETVVSKFITDRPSKAKHIINDIKTLERK